MNGRRGAVLVESALVLSLTLMLLYGALQIGVVGLEQVSVDGGAFVAAHQFSLPCPVGQSCVDPVTLARSAVPVLNSPNAPIGLQTAPPPSTAFNGQYNLNQPNARYGGVSMVQPVQAIATAKRTGISNILMGVTGSFLSVTGETAEPLYQEINPHFDLAGNNFGTAGAFSTAANPLEDSAPPYFVGFSYMELCPYSNPANTAPWTTNCPSGTIPTALGMAEYLDKQNWNRQYNGAAPNYTAVFWETRYHQQLYATIAQKLSLYYGASSGSGAPALRKGILDPSSAEPIKCVYSFDNDNVGAYAAGNVGVGDPLFALHPGGSDSSCPAPL